MFKRHYAKRVRFLQTLLQPGRRTRIADVGASPIKDPDYKALHDLGVCEIWGFEPNPSQFAKLTAQQSDTANYLPNAIGQKGKATLNIHPGNAGLTSAYPFHAPSVRFLGKDRWLEPEFRTEDIDLVSLDSLQGLPPIDVLKMDLQGGERDVLIGGRRKLANAVAIIPEVRFHRIYEGEPLWADLDLQLRKQGFALHRLLFTKSVTLPSRAAKRFAKRKAANQLLDGDAVYIRALDDPSTVSTDQLKHMAIAADGIFQSFDLVAHLLDILADRGELPDSASNDYVDLMPERLLAEMESA